MIAYEKRFHDEAEWRPITHADAIEELEGCKCIRSPWLSLSIIANRARQDQLGAVIITELVRYRAIVKVDEGEES